jgi:DNA-binding MurR/RpiR family transcriptional regulator
MPKEPKAGKVAGRGAAAPSGAVPADSAPPNTVVLIRALVPAMPPAEQRVAQRIIDDPAGVAVLTISELAQACGTSETTVIRFCRAIGFSGYPELRLTLATEAGRAEGVDRNRRTVGGDIGPGDTLEQVVEKITFNDARAVEETAAQLDIGILSRVIDALVSARRVDLYGVGASAVVGADLQRKLHRIGRVAHVWSDVHLALTSAALLTPEDVAIGISHTGVTRDTIDALAEARRHGATTVALTNFPLSPITDAADLVLTTAARETTFRSGATASRLAQLTVVDCMFVGVALRTYAETHRALAATRDAVRGRRVRRQRGGK